MKRTSTHSLVYNENKNKLSRMKKNIANLQKNIY